jgi:hypothetical protein
MAIISALLLIRLRRDEKASSGLALKPTDLPSLPTEQIAHTNSPFTSIPDGTLAPEHRP